MTRLVEITGKALSGEWGINDDDGNGIPVLRTTNFTNEGVVNYNNVITRKITKKNIDEKFLRKGDIIIEKSGGSDNFPVGRVIYFDGKENTYLFNNFTGLLRIKNQEVWHPKYVFYSLFANYKRGGTRNFENKTTGLHNLKTDDYVSQYEVVEIDFKKQVLICEKLDKLYEIIKLRKQELQKLDELIKARFVELFNDKYDTVKIGDVFSTTSGGTPSKSHPEYYENGTIPWLSSGEVNIGVIHSVKNYITQEGVDNSSAKMVPENSVVIAMYGATAGQVGLLRIATTTNQAVCSVLPDKRYVPEYLYYAIKLKKDWMISQCAGGAQPNISQGVIKRMEIIDAPYELQKQFASFVEQTNKSKAAIQKSLNLYQELFDKLMNDYFGG